MKKLLVFCLFVSISSMATAQISRDEKVKQLKNRDDIKVTEVEKDILKIEYPHGKVLIKNVGDYERQTANNPLSTPYSPTYDSTIIDLTTIDTTLYYWKYKFWQEVNVGSPQTGPPLVGDVNNNKLAEIYGQQKEYTASDFSDYIAVMEMNNTGIFDSVYSYDSTRIARAIYDIDKDGMNELFLYRFPHDTNYIGQNWLFFKKQSYTSFATILSFVYGIRNQQNNNTFGDWDGDEFTDQALIGVTPHSLYLSEYCPIINNFDSVYQFDLLQNDLDHVGFAIDDFDQDNKTELFIGSLHGKVLCLENSGNNSYQLTWQGMVETYNAYQLAQTNDVDGNGKKEIWVGGDSFYPGIGAMTRITIFEANGNDNYQVVGRIDLVGIFSLYAQNYQAVDVDKDGIDEMMVCIEETVLILKFNGSPNHQTYELFYFKQNDLMLAGRSSVYYGATMYDVTNDGKEDIIIHLDEYVENLGLRLLTFIYEADFTLGVENPVQFPEQFHLYPNFPNPFNPSTSVRFELSQLNSVSIKIFDILGKEIKLLIEKNLPAGEYTVQWDGKDDKGNILPGGVYFIQMTAGKYRQTIKTVLLK